MSSDDTATTTPSAGDGLARAQAELAAQAREIEALQLALAKREWLLEAIERGHEEAAGGGGIERLRGVGTDEFLRRFYAPGRPVILRGEMADWPALTRWTPDYLKARVGAATVEFQGSRNANPHFEIEKEKHRHAAPFDAFIDAVAGCRPTNDAYLTAFNSDRNMQALAPLAEDLGFLDTFLSRDAAFPQGMPWIGPAGTVTPLHHDLTNNLIAQVVGRKRIKLLPAAMVGRVYNHRHVFSRIADLEDPRLDPAAYPRLAGARVYDVLLEPGDILFVPLGWWHQVKALDFSVTLTFTNFLWANDAALTYPRG